MRHCAFTIVAKNYFALAKTLRESYLEHHPDHDFYIVLVDKYDADFERDNSDIAIVWAQNLGIEGFPLHAIKFDVIELSTNVKPSALLYLLQNHDVALYIDPDIYVYRPLAPIFHALQANSIALTPHSFTPIVDGARPDDIDLMRTGSFNLGFIGVARTEEGLRFLRWWADRCLQFGYHETQSGLFVDQKWIDLVPGYFRGVHILQERGLNVAYWNLHERTISEGDDGHHVVNGSDPLYFFHFSGFQRNDPLTISKYQSRFPHGSRPDINELLQDYALKLSDQNWAHYSNLKYSNDFFDDGIFITPTLRRFVAAHESKFLDDSRPFSPDSEVYRFAIKHKLAGKNIPYQRRETAADVAKYGTQIRIINLALRFALRVFGPNRYYSLMRYIASISSIRNQKGVLAGESPD